MPSETVVAPVDPERRADETTTLTEFLDFHRAVLLGKGEGLTVEQLMQGVGSYESPGVVGIGSTVG